MNKILVIDDDLTTRIGLSVGLRSFFDVDVAENGTAGLEMCALNKYDLVLLDQVMPGMSGEQVLSIMVSRYPGTKVIMHTGIDKKEFRERMILSGAIDLIVKPAPPSVIVDRIQAGIAADRPRDFFSTPC